MKGSLTIDTIFVWDGISMRTRSAFCLSHGMNGRDWGVGFDNSTLVAHVQMDEFT